MGTWKPIGIKSAIDIKKEINISRQGTYIDMIKINTKIGEQIIYNFEDEEGNKFGIYGFTNLNRAMENVQPGEIVRITYKGTKKVQTKFGLKDVHQVDVEIYEKDDENDLPF